MEIHLIYFDVHVLTADERDSVYVESIAGKNQLKHSFLKKKNQVFESLSIPFLFYS